MKPQPILGRMLIALALIVLFGGCAADGSLDNQPPILEIDVPADVTYTVGDGLLRITLTGEDPEGGELRFEVVDGPERAELQTASNWAIFLWDPLAPDVTPADEPLSLVFAAIDPQGARTERVVNVRIQAGNGIPKFTNSNSILHTIGTGKPIAFDVTIRDDDSEMVNLRMPPGFAPDGADLTSTGPLSGRFGWIPQPDQLQQRVHTVKFIADDGQNEPVEQNVTIILKKVTAKPDIQDIEPTDCGFEDRVTYTPLGAQHGAGDYVVEASFTSLNDGYDKIILNYSTDDVFNDYDFEWESVEMTEDADVYIGSIPNPLLASGSTEIYYEICAVNEDAEEGDSREVWCGPTSLYESFIVYPPQTSKCEDDGQADDDFDSAATLDENEFAYRRLCEGDEDYFEIPVGSNQEGYVYLVYPLGMRPTVETFDADQNADVAPEHSDCSGFTTISFENRSGATKKFIKISANADAQDVTYQILTDVRDLNEGADCADAEYEPNESSDEATRITTQSAQFSGLEICRSSDVDVFSFDANTGDEIDITATFTHSIGDLDVMLFLPSEMDEVERDGYGTANGFGIVDDENISYVAEETGTYYLIVYSEDNPNNYGLRLEIQAGANVCADAGDNHVQSNATEVPEGTTSNLSICGNTEDWYSFPVLGPVTPDFTIELTPAQGSDLGFYTLEVWNLFGSVATGIEQNGKLSADLVPMSFGDHWIRVRSTSDSDYDISIASFF